MKKHIFANQSPIHITGSGRGYRRLFCILGKYSVISCFIIELSVVSVGSSSSFQFVNPFLSNNIHKHDRDFLPLQEAAAAEYAAVTGRREEAAAECAGATTAASGATLRQSMVVRLFSPPF